MLAHRITESLRLEKTSKITKSNHQPIPTMPINHVPQCHISTILEVLQGQWRMPPEDTPWYATLISLHLVNVVSCYAIARASPRVHSHKAENMQKAILFQGTCAYMAELIARCGGDGIYQHSRDNKAEKSPSKHAAKGASTSTGKPYAGRMNK